MALETVPVIIVSGKAAAGVANFLRAVPIQGGIADVSGPHEIPADVFKWLTDRVFPAFGVSDGQPEAPSPSE